MAVQYVRPGPGASGADGVWSGGEAVLLGFHGGESCAGAAALTAPPRRGDTAESGEKGDGSCDTGDIRGFFRAGAVPGDELNRYHQAILHKIG